VVKRRALGMRRSLLLVLAAAAACQATDRPDFGVQLRLSADSSVSDERLARIVRLDFAVSGIETAHTSVAPQRALQRSERIIYRPQAQTRGELRFVLTAWDGAGTAVATGMTLAEVTADQLVSVDLPLGASPDPADPCRLAPQATELYVNGAAGAAGATGTVGCPFATISEAIAASTPYTATIHVARGTYGESSETFPLVLRNGLALVGDGIDQTIIRGSRAFATYWDTFQTTVVLGDASGTNLLSNLTVLPSDRVAPGTSHYIGVICDRGTPNNLSAALRKVAVGPGFDMAVLLTNNSGSCNLELTGSQIRGNVMGIWAQANSGNPCTQFARLQIGGDGKDAANVFRDNNLSTGTFNIGAAGVDIWDCAVAQVIGNTFENGTGGIYIGQGLFPTGVEPHVIRDNVFRKQSLYGVALTKNATVERLEGNLFTQNSSPAHATAGLWARDTSEVRTARGNRFIGNDYGVWFDGAAFPDVRTVANDFGTADDPGRNVFSCNSAPGSMSGGYDFAVTADKANRRTGTLSLFGNQWDALPPVPIANGTARAGADLYAGTAVLAISGNDSGTQVDTPIVCPDGRAP
jgi:hypothetical protein